MVQGPTGPHLLPSRHSRDAPEKFKGHYYKVTDFIQQYKQVLADCQITDDQEKCEGITNYCSTKVCQLIESLDEYRANNWSALKKQILKLYDADREQAQYQKQDIESIIKTYSQKPLENLTAWKHYVQEFMVIAQGLKNDKVIQEGDFDTYFWLGILKGMREKVETHLLAGSPTKDISQPFTVEEISNTMERLLHQYQFNWKGCSADHCYTEPTPESDDSSDESDYHSRKQYRKNKVSRRTPEPSPTREWPPRSHMKKHKEEKKSTKAPSREIDQLINDMSKLNISDPAYVVAYFKALMINPKVTQVFDKLKKEGALGRDN
ncbi:hypothetical protein OG21DRAFT_1490321 [Imleria badia]|nr:hypothetical protein OG21DRAFT_1490321 [Imleria badia]